MTRTEPFSSWARRRVAVGLLSPVQSMKVTPRKVERELRSAAAYHPQQLIPQPGGRLDIDLPADLDDQRETGQTATLRSAVSVRSGTCDRGCGPTSVRDMILSEGEAERAWPAATGIRR
jgi:hypothetical protein